MDAELASTSRMWQSGQAADTMSRSRLISSAQPLSPAGNGDVPPFWLIFLKQPFAVVQAGRPKWLRYAPRSAAALGSSIASTIATVRPLACLPDTLYAD